MANTKFIKIAIGSEKEYQVLVGLINNAMDEGKIDDIGIKTSNEKEFNNSEA